MKLSYDELRKLFLASGREEDREADAEDYRERIELDKKAKEGR